jgi:hypothetical protein
MFGLILFMEVLVLVVQARNLEGKRPLEKTERTNRWKDGSRIDFMETGWEGGEEWIQLTQDRDRWRALVNTVMNFLVLAPRS